MKTQTMTVQDYYENVDFSPLFKISPTFFKWRQIRVKIKKRNGKYRMVKVNDQIKNPEDLKKAILSLIEQGSIPIKVYYQAARFIQPQSVGPRIHKGYKYSPTFLFRDWIVFDVDTLDKLQVLKLHELMKGYKLIYCCFSGSRGYHVAYKIKVKCDIADPEIRELWYQNFLNEFVDSIIEKGIEVDEGPTKNVRGIYKVPLSLDLSSGKVCELEDINALVTRNANETALRGCNKGRVERAKVSSPATFILNKVNGTKDRFILVLNFKELEGIKKKLTTLIKNYKLTDFYIYKSVRQYQAICLKALKKRRIEKIVRASGTKSTVFRYGIQYLEPIQEYITTVKSPLRTRQTSFISRPHFLLLKNIIPVSEYPKLCGNETISYKEVKITHG